MSATDQTPAVRAAEWSLITGTRTKSEAIAGSSDVLDLLNLFLDGAYADILKSPLVTSHLATNTKTWNGKDTIESLFDSAGRVQGQTSVDDELLRLVIIASCVHAFLQTNWTGPELHTSPLEVLGLVDTDARALNDQAIAELAYRGEPAYHLARDAAFLRVAQILMDQPWTHSETHSWWSMRLWTLHQYMLDEPAALPADVTDGFDAFCDSLKQREDSELLGRFLLERGLVEHHFSQDRNAAEMFVEAAKRTGLRYELTGALGKRTKFQQNDLSQLVLLAESKGTPVDVSADEKKATIPETLALNDDTLLEHTQFTVSSSGAGALAHIDPGNQPTLDPLDQCILLALCLNVRNTSPVHGLTNEQMAPYVTRVLENPRNWSVHTMGLLLRARLEAGRTRTVERSVLQLQALVDQMKTTVEDAAKPADSAPASERLAYIFDLVLPSRWQMERELGRRLLELGVVRSALDIFTRLEIWDEAVRCYAMLEQPERAIQLVRDLLSGTRVESDTVTARSRGRLDKAREAKLWCLLGDLEPGNAEKHYLHAWSISGESSGRAARALGSLYFSRDAYEKAIPFLETGARINPLLTKTWFLLGCAEMRKERPDWKSARDAFAMCVAIDDEDAESWNNLATVYLRMEGEKKGSPDEESTQSSRTRDEQQYSNRLAAFRALRNGLKNAHNNWRMWSNYSIVAFEVGELHECIRALQRIIEERSEKDGADCVDVDMLQALVGKVTRDTEGKDGLIAPASIVVEEGLAAIAEDGETQPLVRTGTLHFRLTALFEQTILPRVSSPRIFKAYAQLKTADGDFGAALKAHMDAYRAASAASSSFDTVESCRKALGEVEEAVDVLRNLGPKAEGQGEEGKEGKWKVQARGLVRTFAARARDFQDEPEWDRVKILQDELKKSTD